MDKNNFYVLALNHKATAIENIGDFTVNPDEYKVIVESLYRFDGVEELVYLSTCNRVEIWIYKSGELNKNEIINHIFNGDCFGRFLKVKNDFFELEADLALLHMVNVSCSLDSMVVGEREIFGQLRQAFNKANNLNVCGKNLNLAFRKITEVSKSVYSRTEIANQKVSVASIACFELRKFIKDIESTNITLIGAGETIQLVSKYLSNHNFNEISVLNRTKENGYKIKDIIESVKVNSLSEIEHILPYSEVVITCTSSPEPIITSNFIEKERSYTILDLAVPSDTSEEVKKMKNVHFIGVDELKEIAKNNIKSRLKDLSHAASIAHEGWEELIQFLKEREVVFKTQQVHHEIDEMFKDVFLNEQMQKMNERDVVTTTEMLRYFNKKLNKIPAKISKDILIQKNA